VLCRTANISPVIRPAATTVRSWCLSQAGYSVGRRGRYSTGRALLEHLQPDGILTRWSTSARCFQV